MHRCALLLIAGFLAGVVAIPISAGAAAASKLKVVVTITILGDMVQQVGGEHVALATLVGPDGDAHAYEPTPSDARR
jgi:zinc/manganese transport system substrate-binding protein